MYIQHLLHNIQILITLNSSGINTNFKPTTGGGKLFRVLFYYFFFLKKKYNMNERIQSIYSQLKKKIQYINKLVY